MAQRRWREVRLIAGHINCPWHACTLACQHAPCRPLAAQHGTYPPPPARAGWRRVVTGRAQPHHEHDWCSRWCRACCQPLERGGALGARLHACVREASWWRRHCWLQDSSLAIASTDLLFAANGTCACRPRVPACMCVAMYARTHVCLCEHTACGLSSNGRKGRTGACVWKCLCVPRIAASPPRHLPPRPGACSRARG